MDSRPVLPQEMPVLSMLDSYVSRAGERWHMPGHKGRRPEFGDFLHWSYDVTEIDEMLQTPNPVERSEELMARSYGADRTWYSVAGATLPVLAGMLAAFPPGATVWVDRTMHRSVFGALVLGGYQVKWLYPSLVQAGLTLPVAKAPPAWEEARGIVLTRPTYDGIAADIAPIIAACHAANGVVMVDEAHGSHWMVSPYPVSALQLGADVVAHGVHKTQDALTQTGLLHIQGHRVMADEVDRWWRVLATTSPSYLLLASLDRLQWARRQPHYAERWRAAAEAALVLREDLAAAGWVIWQAWAERQGYAADPLRLTVMGPGSAVEARVKRVGRVEKTTQDSCTFLLSPGQNFDALKEALGPAPLVPSPQALNPMPYPALETAMSIRDAWLHPGRWVPLRDAVGLVAKDALTPYPPGVPVAVAGEVLTRNIVDWLLDWHAAGRAVIQGVKPQGDDLWVWVVEA
ncbi:MAG: arginine decarboxylase [Firmicutes bacterium]|nr:arginine decarboxylase [Bacillota bacterium]